MEFNAYLQIKELDSEGTPTECLDADGKATEVSMGADDVAIEWISPDLRASVNAKFTFSSGGSPTLLGVSSGFELLGALSFETFEISYLGANLAFGELLTRSLRHPQNIVGGEEGRRNHARSRIDYDQ